MWSSGFLDLTSPHLLTTPPTTLRLIADYIKLNDPKLIALIKNFDEAGDNENFPRGNSSNIKNNISI